MSTVCGTAGYTGPSPGDPDNSSVLSAAAAFGGIDITWSYPGVNPHAVAHFKLYRSTSGTEGTQVLHTTENGNFFYDKTVGTTTTEYFYWLSVVSANDGHESEMIGPVSAIARPTIEDVMADLTNQIDQGHLSQSLKEPIGRIDDNAAEIAQEKMDRAAEDDALGFAFSQVQGEVDEAKASIINEQEARAEANSAMVSSQNLLQVELDDFYSAVNLNMGAVLETDSNGDLVESGAIFAPTVDVNGVIGGFGLYNDGNIVEMGFDVDRFWVGRTSTEKGGQRGTKPFIIEGDEVFINQAVIKELVVGKLRSEDGSFAFTPAVYDSNGNVTTPSKLKANYVDAKNLTVKKALTVPKASIDTIEIKDGAIKRAKIGTAAVGTTEIGDATINNAKISNGSVSRLKIGGNAVTATQSGQRSDANALTLSSFDLSNTDSNFVLIIWSDARSDGVSDTSTSSPPDWRLYIQARERVGGSWGGWTTIKTQFSQTGSYIIQFNSSTQTYFYSYFDRSIHTSYSPSSSATRVQVRQTTNSNVSNSDIEDRVLTATAGYR